MKVDVKSEFVQWMLRTRASRLTDIPLKIMALYAILTDKGKVWPLKPNGEVDVPAQRYELFFESLKIDGKLDVPAQQLEMVFESLKINRFEYINFWMEFFSKKKIKVLVQEAFDDTHLPLCIENEATKDKWLKWLDALAFGFLDKKNGEILVSKCYFVGNYVALLGLGATKEMELQDLQNIESVCFALVTKGSIFINNYRTDYLKTVSAKRSASPKTKQVNVDRAKVKAIFEKWEQKNCAAFRAEAMLAIDKTDRTVQNRLKELLEGQ